MGAPYPLSRPIFNPALRIEVRPERLSSDAGVLVMRELADRLGIIAWFSAHIHDPRSPMHTTWSMPELLRTLLFLLTQGYTDLDDADRLRDDPAFALAIADSTGDKPLRGEARAGLMSQPTLSRATHTLATEDHRTVLRCGLIEVAARSRAARSQTTEPFWLDLDSLPVNVYGHQAGSAYNGYYHRRCFHPLALSIGETGELLGLWLREGQVASKADAIEVFGPTLAAIRWRMGEVAGVRIDAGFPCEEVLGALEAMDLPYITRLKSNAVLKRLAGPIHRLPHLPAPEGEAATRFTVFEYKAGPWSRARRVVAVSIQEPGESKVRTFYLATSLDDWPAAEVLACYRRRGCAESRYGQWMNALDPKLSSAPRPKSRYRQHPVEPPVESLQEPLDGFAVNEVRLLLSAVAQNLLCAVRDLVEADTGRGWTLRSVREKGLKVACRFLLGARQVLAVVPESASALWKGLWTRLNAMVPQPLLT